MTKASVNLQDLRRRIYLKAKAEKSWRFWGLYVHVCKMETLREGYTLAKQTDGAPSDLRGLRNARRDWLPAEDHAKGQRQARRSARRGYLTTAQQPLPHRGGQDAGAGERDHALRQVHLHRVRKIGG